MAELVIAMGILVLMMSLAGQVFTFTMRSTGQATALTDVMQQLRTFEQTLREDLRYVNPGESLILIQGNPVNAYWTQDGQTGDATATGSDGDPATGYTHARDPEREDTRGNLVKPRADILMFFTSRPATSFTDAAKGVNSNLQGVVYGHAELGEYVPSTTAGGDAYEFQPLRTEPTFPLESISTGYPSATEVAKVPAEQWHLARRSILLTPTPSPAPMVPPLTQFDDVRLLRSETDIRYNTNFEVEVLRPHLNQTTGDPLGGPWYPPGIFWDTTDQPIRPHKRSLLDPTPPPAYAARMGHYFLPNCASFKVEWALNSRSQFVNGRLDGANEVFWFDPGWPGDPNLDNADPCRLADPLCSLARRVKAMKDQAGGACGPRDTVCQNLDNLAGVGDAYRTNHLDGTKYSLSDRFRGRGLTRDPDAWDQLSPDKERPNTVVFTATRPGAGGSEPVPDDMFPGALRITVDLYDHARRLDRPMRHVMVIPIGG